MSQAPMYEFCRDLRPIAQVFQPGALPEIYIANAPAGEYCRWRSSEIEMTARTA